MDFNERMRMLNILEKMETQKAFAKKIGIVDASAFSSSQDHRADKIRASRQ